MSGTLLAYGDKVIGVVAKDNGSVQVVADGVKTVSQLLNELYTLIDLTKIKPSSYVVLKTATADFFYRAIRLNVDSVEFSCTTIPNSTTEQIRGITISSTSECYMSTNGTISDVGSSVQPSGVKYQLFY